MTDRAEAARLIGVASYLWAHMRQATDKPLELNIMACLLIRETMRFALESGYDPAQYAECVNQASKRASELSQTVAPTPSVVKVGQG